MKHIETPAPAVESGAHAVARILRMKPEEMGLAGELYAALMQPVEELKGRDLEQRMSHVWNLVMTNRPPAYLTPEQQQAIANRLTSVYMEYYVGSTGFGC